MLGKQENGPILEVSMRKMEPSNPSWSPVPGIMIGSGLEEFMVSGNEGMKKMKVNI